MTNNTKDFKQCVSIEHPNVAKGWGCCICRTYNGDQRPQCKICKHSRCDTKLENKPS